MSENHITAEELFNRIRTVMSPDTERRACEMHETLLLVCEAGLRDTRHDFGGLSSKVDALCRRLGFSSADTIAVQRMRRHGNSAAPLTEEELLSDCLALCRLVEAVFNVSAPEDITARLPRTFIHQRKGVRTRYSYIRCTVRTWDGERMTVLPDDDEDNGLMSVRYSAPLPDCSRGYLTAILREGMQLNLIDCKDTGDGLVPDIIIVEPDFLVDISALANCFEPFGHHPLLYTLNRLKERANTRHTLLGNFAGRALDEIINNPDATTADILRSNFREKALEYATCADFDAAEFKRGAATQASNIRQIADEIFAGRDRRKAVLEPSFVCERLGISGRADLMTTDLRLLVEQKSGRNMFIERGYGNPYGGRHIEKHYVQLLLYHAILCQNFDLKSKSTDIYLMYSRYALPSGLLEVEALKKLLIEALRLRNAIVATEYSIAHGGFSSVLPSLNAVTLNLSGCSDLFFERYLRPQIDALTLPLQSLSPVERAYLCRMMTFVAKEQIMSKAGTKSGTGTSAADLWNMPVPEKVETGNIYIRMRLLSAEKSDPDGGYDTLTLVNGKPDPAFLPNFRRGDMVCVYSYKDGEQPDARRSMLFKGVVADMRTGLITVRLNDGQRNKEAFTAAADGTANTLFAVEHGSSDISGTAAMRSLYVLMTAEPQRRALLLGQRTPRRDTSIRLSRSYGKNLDDILLKAKQAADFFLLVGPPGTGKTSVVLRHIVEEHLSDNGENRLLLTAYTNRAADEICAMLREAGIGFLRMGGQYSCDPSFRDNLMASEAARCPRLDGLRAAMREKRVVVGTTATLVSRPFIFSLMHFSLAVVDEAGQLTEPNIVGLLSACSNDTPRRNCIDKFILIGDYKQLPAIVQQSERESAVEEPLLQDIGLRDCRSSLFERLVRRERAAGRTDFVGVLRRQGRMHPDVAEFPNRMFYRDERLLPVPCPHQTDTSIGYSAPSEDSIDDALRSRRMVFIPSRPCRDEAVSEKVNTSEARIAASLLRRIRRLLGSRFDAEKSVGVIVPYRNQIAMIRQELEKLRLPELEQVSIDTVERYQGSQRDIIIYSFTAHRRYQLDFLTANRTEDNGMVIDRKLNVALTRARKQMIVTGNPDIISKDPIFRQLIDFIRSKGGVMSHISA